MWQNQWRNQVKQACEGRRTSLAVAGQTLTREVWPARLSANEDHLANNYWRSLLRLTNQKCTRNVKRTTKTSDMALLLLNDSPFAILDAPHLDCEFPLTHCSLPHTHMASGSHSNLRTRLPFFILLPPEKLLVNWVTALCYTCTWM